MTMRFETVLQLFPDLRPGELTQWIELHWIEPEKIDGGNWHFHDIDVARVRLVYDLRRQMEAPEETVSLVLSLLDQVYDLRCDLRNMVSALEAQPVQVKQAVLEKLKVVSIPK